jgi:hypothetical protein
MAGGWVASPRRSRVASELPVRKTFTARCVHHGFGFDQEPAMRPDGGAAKHFAHTIHETAARDFDTARSVA